MTKNEHKATELSLLFYRELSKTHHNDAWPVAAKNDALARLLELLFIETTKAEKIHFTTLFARIAFACHKFQVDKKTQYWTHHFRKKLRGAEDAASLYPLGLKVLADCIEALFGVGPPSEVRAFLPKKYPFKYTEVKVEAFRKEVRAVAFQDDEKNDRLIAQAEDHPAGSVFIQYNIAERNEPFNPSIRQIRQTFGFPVTLSLLDVEITTESGTPVYRPRAIVIEPDFLIDVSAVADCFQGSSAEPVLYLLKKYLPVEPSVPMMVGNIANFFLDELMHNPQAVFKETFPKVFKINPLAFALLPDATILEIYKLSQKHWATLQQMVASGMKKSGIEPSACYLEPSFYADALGLQGRLDVFFKNEQKSAIIELKSGKPFMPNRHGIGASHFIQTLLYDLIVRSVFKEEVEPASYILYSGLDTGQLKYAPPVKSEQNEALQVRNQLMALERQLGSIHGAVENAPVLQKINTQRFPHIKGYNSKSIELFEKTYASLSDLERRYFNAFSGFIAREHHLAKTGIQGVDNANGLAALWLDPVETKEANYQIINALTIKENRAFEDEALIVFEKPPGANPLANFRVGDIAVLYPTATNPPNGGASNQFIPSGPPITTQIFKTTILAISPEEVTVRLRYKQFNLGIFKENKSWALEHDQMDMSFNAMYQGLFSFAQSPPGKRALLLTERPPAHVLDDHVLEGLFSPGFTDEQNRILRKMLAAQDYFLLWGPPGTGKTSQMLKCYAGWLFENTDENLLLLAYTNRAVDEICEALDSLGKEVKESYLRIGSRYSTGKQFEDQLLGNKIEGIGTRAELKAILNRHRVFVSTLSSLSNNLELLKLKKFRRVAIDEASQILEPALVGLLPHFEQFILIGDHKQLPAVVVQEPAASATSDEMLHGAGLQNLRNSLFERLYRRCLAQGWHWAFDHLSHQGRMHQEIMAFPGVQFYEGKLKILPDSIEQAAKQKAPLPACAGPMENNWEGLLMKKRMAFIPSETDTQSLSRKTNRHEAQLIAQLVRFFQKWRAGKSIGVITPYRAQIALIQEVLQSAKMDCNDLTIDTVERYQGGARDIILLSLCVNAASQLEALVSLSDEGVDRKLNVALTRAREHIVIVGNEGLLKQNEVYNQLILHCKG